MKARAYDVMQAAKAAYDRTAQAWIPVMVRREDNGAIVLTPLDQA